MLFTDGVYENSLICDHEKYISKNLNALVIKHRKHIYEHISISLRKYCIFSFFVSTLQDITFLFDKIYEASDFIVIAQNKQYIYIIRSQNPYVFDSNDSTMN